MPTAQAPAPAGERYVIDLLSEDVFPLIELADRAPLWKGRKRHHTFGYRMAKLGLPTIIVGNALYTSMQAWQWFCQRRTFGDGTPTPSRTTAARRRALDRASRQLDEMGV
jgi:hypothetical protein